jgi:nitrite reductase (NADH) large subunit
VAALAVLIAGALMLPWNLPDPTTVRDAGWLHRLWRDEFWKQVSGYSLLGMSAVALLMSLRKRVKRVSLGNFSSWRVMHVIVGAVAAVLLLAHTGGRAGANLNLALGASFIAAVLLGAAASAFTAGEPRAGARGRTRRRWSTWLHIVVLWPLPALLALHIVSAYYF